MATSYNLKSTNIQIFPTAGRPDYDPVGRLTTEYNLTSILNRLLDTDGFVITKCAPNGDIFNNVQNHSDTPFDFNIHGYLIHIDELEALISSNDSNTNYSNACFKISDTEENKDNVLYAIIDIATKRGNDDEKNKHYHQRVDAIFGQDSGNSGPDTDKSTYSGVNFILNPKADELEKIPEGAHARYFLPILKYTGTHWTVPEESKIKFTTSTDNKSRSVTIDDGVI